MAIEDGSLDVSSAKISRQHKENLNKTLLICIYTYENAIDLVRKQLSDLGFAIPLCYKMNESTDSHLKGCYSHLICEKDER